MSFANFGANCDNVFSIFVPPLRETGQPRVNLWSGERSATTPETDPFMTTFRSRRRSADAELTDPPGRKTDGHHRDRDKFAEQSKRRRVHFSTPRRRCGECIARRSPAVRSYRASCQAPLNVDEQLDVRRRDEEQDA
jgi:hypothetical protein